MRQNASTYLLTFSLFLNLFLVSANDYVIHNNFEKHLFSDEISYGQFDKITTLGEKILQQPDSLFKKNSSSFFNLGYFKSPYWFKTTITNNSSQTDFSFCIQQFFFDSCRVFIIYNDSTVTFPLQGIRMASPNRIFNHHFFPIRLNENQKATLVWKLSNSTGSLRSYFSLYSKVKKEAIVAEFEKIPVRDAFFVGFLASVTIATFMFFLINNNLTYLFYSLFILTNLLTRLNIRASLLPLWDMTSTFFPKDIRIQLSLSMYAFALLYVRVFFKGISKNNLTITISNISLIGLITSFVISLFDIPQNLLIQKTILTAAILFMGLAVATNFSLIIEAAIKKYKPAYFFLAGYLIPFFVATTYFLMQLQIIDGGYLSELWGYGLLLEIIILSFSLSLKTRDIRYQNKLLNEKLLHQQQDFINQTIELQEAERAKIARDLHDGLGQRLTGLKLNWFSLAKTLPQKDNEANFFSQSLQEAIEDVRIISHQMLPKNLMKAGIIHATEALCDSINSENCSIKFTHNNSDINLLPDVAIHLYRSTQECIQNAIRHGEASEIHIHLALVGNKLILQIHDNGVGYNTKSTEKGFGLLNITNRVKSINGFFNIESSSKTGTSIIIRIPYEKN